MKSSSTTLIPSFSGLLEIQNLLHDAGTHPVCHRAPYTHIHPHRHSSGSFIYILASYSGGRRKPKPWCRVGHRDLTWRTWASDRSRTLELRPHSGVYTPTTPWIRIKYCEALSGKCTFIVYMKKKTRQKLTCLTLSCKQTQMHVIFI